MKTTIRVATKDQYCYVEKEVDMSSPQAIRDEYNTLFAVMNGEPTDSNFNAYLIELFDSNLSTKEGENKWRTADFYDSLSISQQKVVQSVKRYLARLKNK